MTPKEYKNKMMVKVVGSTISTTPDKDALIGKIVEVKRLDYFNNTLWLWTGPGDYGAFNLSDVQIATPVMYEGVNVCVLDKVFWNGSWRTVTDYIWHDFEYRLITEMGDYQSTQMLTVRDIKALDPLYKEKEELAVGSEAELTLKNGLTYKVTINNIK